MSDKRDECGCHKDCTYVDHECPNPCWWPSCLTREESDELTEEISKDLW